MDSIRDFLHTEVASNHTPSIQYAFFKTDTTVFSIRYGCSDISNGRMVDAATTLNLFSITKTFTALAVLQLAEAGVLKLDESIKKYFPAIPYPDTITIEKLLTHTAGLPNPLPLRWTHLLADHAGFNRDLFFNDVFKKNNHVNSAPGSRFHYSNLHYVLLGQLIEKLSGKQFETFIKENILDRAQVAGSDLGFIIDPAVHAKGYQKYWTITNALLGFMIDKDKTMDRREGKWKPFRHFYVNGTAYGGLVGTANGLIKYAQALLKNNSPLLSDVGKRLLFTENRIDKKPTGMAMAWFTGNLNGNTYVAHAGGGGGYYVELRLYPELGSGSVILNNRTGMSDERMLNKTDSFFMSAQRTF